MARDDYHVIAYKILVYLYECLKRGEKPKQVYYSDIAYDINRAYWENIMRCLSQEGLIEGLIIGNVVGCSEPMISTRNIMITPKGIEYLEENSTIAKAAEFLKMLKETIPGL